MLTPRAASSARPGGASLAPAFAAEDRADTIPVQSLQPRTVAGHDADPGVQGEGCPELVQGPPAVVPLVHLGRGLRCEQLRAEPGAHISNTIPHRFPRSSHRPVPSRTRTINSVGRRLPPHHQSPKANGAPRWPFFLRYTVGLREFIRVLSDFGDRLAPPVWDGFRSLRAVLLSRSARCLWAKSASTRISPSTIQWVTCGRIKRFHAIIAYPEEIANPMKNPSQGHWNWGTLRASGGEFWLLR
jgi:hypothetical protein